MHPEQSDEGGESACIEHLDAVARPVVADLSAITDVGGAVWNLRDGAGDDVDLDANFVRLEAGASIESHVNRELDVLIVLQAGSLTLTIDGTPLELGPGSIGFVPRGSQRSIDAGEAGVSYLSIHRRRGPMQPFRR